MKTVQLLDHYSKFEKKIYLATSNEKNSNSMQSYKKRTLNLEAVYTSKTDFWHAYKINSI